MFGELIRAVIIYAVITLAVRVMGKRQVGDLQPAELVITILVSEVAAMPIEDPNKPLLAGITAVFALVIMEIIMSVLSMKIPLLRRAVNGRSTLVIENGRIDQTALRRLRLTVTDLMEMLRGENVFDVSEVSFAILETNGNLSVLQKPRFRPATASPAPDSGMPTLVISDGRFLKDSAARLNVGRGDVERMLKEEGLRIEDVFLMTLDSAGGRVTVRKDGK